MIHPTPAETIEDGLHDDAMQNILALAYARYVALPPVVVIRKESHEGPDS